MQSRWIRALQALLIGILLVGVSATASAAGYYVRNGKIYRPNGQELQVKGISHFGFNSTTLQPQYLWQMGWKEQIAQMKSLGFNAIRVPFVPDTLYNTTPVDQLSYVDPNLNPELLGKTPLQVLDLWMAEANRQGMYVMLDFHSVSKHQQYPTWFVSNPADYHLMYNGKAYTEANWIRDLKFVASRYASNSHFFGIDLYNEPNANVRWSTGDPNVTDPAYYWKRAAESASSAVLQANPKLLIFVQGIAGNFDGVEDSNIPMNWGEDLQPHRYQKLNIPANKLVLTPHTYGPDVYMKSSFSDHSFPANLAADWDALFGRYYPANAVVIGEWGGRYGNGPSGEMDVTWQNALVDYLTRKGIHGSFYWCYTPNSSDTGGILNDDLTVRQDKMTLLKRHWGKSRSENETPDPEAPPVEPEEEGAAPPPAAPAEADAPAVNSGSSGGGGASWLLPIVAAFAVAGRIVRRKPGAAS
jgi:aryl-phospho-beta-D-glucosidase BglC (GH1 family)